MKHLLQSLTFFFFISCFLQFGCTKDEASPKSIELWVAVNDTFELTFVSKAPEYIGGQEALFKAIGTEIRYPPEARENDIQGTVILQYEVTKTGEVENIVILEDIGGGCGAETKRMFEVITEGVSFHPAEIDGTPVRIRMELSIKFIL